MTPYGLAMIQLTRRMWFGRLGSRALPMPSVLPALLRRPPARALSRAAH